MFPQLLSQSILFPPICSTNDQVPHTSILGRVANSKPRALSPVRLSGRVLGENGSSHMLTWRRSNYWLQLVTTALKFRCSGFVLVFFGGFFCCFCRSLQQSCVTSVTADAQNAVMTSCLHRFWLPLWPKTIHPSSSSSSSARQHHTPGLRGYQLRMLPPATPS